MKILVLGIGNILFGDEGIGVHLSNFLKLNYRFSGENEVDFVDGGTLATMLIPLITSYDKVLILDCVSANNANVGEVYYFDFDNVPQIITWAGSAHEVEMLQTLRLTAINGDLPPVKIIGIIPEVIGEETAFTLSDSVKEGAKLMEKLALEFLEQNGIHAEKIDNKDLQEVANGSFRGYE
ncbi:MULTISPECIES: HyaD/HybD family hydrogenase maturation endopeptidase [Helicobacter]|uniref:HyaD/HybD family hydrogenase maturation endopeptidase n=1 Tax=Helicobacter typhlonius TaxID=76936 RepID=A0A099UF60_9HELI|nr:MULTISPECIES: HyaD/HybD family hydrogenase maturation endopeptidase [Helicobacter]TLD78452.1 HyaD/HybD family hydrogenase maturation endopeptidase [Helicobacter typhlonius]TLD88755.1 HyaD/HybD family hydrogenase maturation endopeptidase [Helicobacter sp. MIT 03-1616]CUU39692.1 Hydrogenase maturation protease [Helicobacter typhlonius]